MDNKVISIIAVVVVAVAIAASAGFVLLNNNNSHNYAHNYTIYTEVIADDGSVSSEKTVKFGIDTQDNQTFVEAANAALSKAGVTASFSIKENGNVSVTYGTDNGNNATYYYNESTKAWAEVAESKTDYVGNYTLALMLQNGYITNDTYTVMPISQQAGYRETGWGDPYAYIKLCDTNPGQTGYNYTIMAEIIDDDGTVMDSKLVKFNIANKDNTSFVAGANAAFTAAGVTASFSINESGYVSVTYGTDNGNNATYYYNESTKAWAEVAESKTDYVNNSYIALELQNGYISETTYAALNALDASGYRETGWGGTYAFIKLPDYDVTKYSYAILTEVIADDGTVSSNKVVRVNITARDNASFVAGANAAFTAAGVTASFAVQNDGSLSVTYGTDNGNNATYFYDYSADSWTAVNDTKTEYVGNIFLALMLQNGYISESTYTALSNDDKDGYQETGWGGDYAYIKLPDFSFEL